MWPSDEMANNLQRFGVAMTTDEMRDRLPAVGLDTPRVFRHQERWGHSIGWQNIDKGRLVGWLTPKPRVGDEFHSDMRSGRIGVYRITKIDHAHGVHDMFFADTEWAGYLDDQEDAEA